MINLLGFQHYFTSQEYYQAKTCPWLYILARNHMDTAAHIFSLIFLDQPELEFLFQASDNYRRSLLHNYAWA